jgi:hypothetical protein
MLLLQPGQGATQEIHRDIERDVLGRLQARESRAAFSQLPAPRSISTQPLPARAAIAGATLAKIDASVRVG